MVVYVTLGTQDQAAVHARLAMPELTKSARVVMRVVNVGKENTRLHRVHRSVWIVLTSPFLTYRKRLVFVMKGMMAQSQARARHVPLENIHRRLALPRAWTVKQERIQLLRVLDFVCVVMAEHIKTLPVVVFARNVHFPRIRTMVAGQLVVCRVLPIGNARILLELVMP
jgi:hypothetical protein